MIWKTSYEIRRVKAIKCLQNLNIKALSEKVRKFSARLKLIKSYSKYEWYLEKIFNYANILWVWFLNILFYKTILILSL
jgi:hypothetical protein